MTLQRGRKRPWLTGIRSQAQPCLEHLQALPSQPLAPPHLTELHACALSQLLKVSEILPPCACPRDTEMCPWGFGASWEVTHPLFCFHHQRRSEPQGQQLQDPQNLPGSFSRDSLCFPFQILWTHGGVQSQKSMSRFQSISPQSTRNCIW